MKNLNDSKSFFLFFLIIIVIIIFSEPDNKQQNINMLKHRQKLFTPPVQRLTSLDDYTHFFNSRPDVQAVLWPHLPLTSHIETRSDFEVVARGCQIRANGNIEKLETWLGLKKNRLSLVVLQK